MTASDRSIALHPTGSSLRVRAPRETLELARKWAPNFGITRVVQTTWLDRAGIPVYASIRPEGDLLCVHSGKGSTDVDAEVGAYMEAIEFEVAERFRHQAGQLYAVHELDEIYRGHGFTFDDLPPTIGTSFKRSDKVVCHDMQDVRSGDTLPIPAELIYLGTRHGGGGSSPAPGGMLIFGTSTNGLASGNSHVEAVLHALCELVERDANAFETLKMRSLPLAEAGLPQLVQAMVERLRAAGLDLFVRYTSAVGGLPHFVALLMEAKDDAPLGLTNGSACHPLKSIALVRAISEAAQARCVHIHGGRDDVVERHKLVRAMGETREIKANARLRFLLSQGASKVTYDEIPEPLGAHSSVDGFLDALCDALREAGFPRVLALPLETSTDGLHVVRVVVPGLEIFEHSGFRAGPRLRAYAEEHDRIPLLEGYSRLLRRLSGA